MLEAEIGQLDQGASKYGANFSVFPQPGLTSACSLAAFWIGPKSSIICEMEDF